MNDNQLRQLLTDADSALSRSVEAPPDESQKICAELTRRKRRASRQIRAGLVATAAAVLLSLVWLGSHEKDDTSQIAEAPNPPVDVQVRATPQQEAAAFKAQIAILERELEALQLAHLDAQLEDITSQLSDSSYSPTLTRLRMELHEEQERTVGIIVCTANYKQERYQLTEQARADYRHVCETFPDSYWAGIASEKLSALRNDR